MENRYQKSTIRNVLRILDREDALSLIALAQAANDLNLNIEAIGKFTESQNLFFFVSSLSILRELAKLVSKIDERAFKGKMSSNTVDLLREIKINLASFDAGSLVMETLKPIRDVTFHYDYERGIKKSLIDQALSKIASGAVLEVNFVEGVTSLDGQRYLFAETFRSHILNQILNTELISTISAISVSILSLVDSLLTDLQNSHES